MFEGAHPHLLLNHFPIVGTFAAVLVLAGGIIFKNKSVKIAGLVLFVIMGIITLPAYFTGEDAEHALKQVVPTLSEELVHEHEEAGEFSLISMMITGGLSLIALFMIWKQRNFAKYLTIIVLISGLWATSVGFRTGYLGGKIRHTEIDQPAAVDPN